MANGRRSVDDPLSRFVHGGTTTTFPTRLGWWERRQFPADVTDIEYIIPPEYSGRPDRLARDLYGKYHYQFLILQYNNILDPVTEFITGVEIKLPVAERAFLDFFNQRTGGIDPDQ